MPKIHTLIEKGDVKGVLSKIQRDSKVVNEALSKTEPDQPLHIAAWQNRADIALILINATANINAQGDGGKTPLHYAAQHGALEVASLLINAGAELNSKDNRGYSPILYAVRGREPACLQVAQQLRKAGALVDLNCLVSLGDTGSVNELLSRNPNAIQQTTEPNSLFEDAVVMIGWKTSFGSTSQITDKVVDRYADLFSQLKSAGADINAIGSTGLPALFTAIQANNAPLVRLLLELGADVNFRLHEYGSPIDAMSLTDGSEGKHMRQLLKEYGFERA